MESLITEADARGAAQVFLEVRADNPNARALYDSLGFEQIAVRKNYYQPDNVDAQVMRLDVANADAEPLDEDDS
jgi:ribosomal protein S18 acetylase RimI-like enzyme